MTNWIEGRNPFKLAMPAPWWLQLLKDYDDQLVLIPSVKDHCYRLTRRASHKARLGASQMGVVHTHPDTVQLASLGLVPIATVHTWAVSSDKIIRDLMARDFRRHGGAAKVLAETEYAERRLEEKRDSQQADTLVHLGNDALTSLRFRTGSAVSMRERPETRPVAPGGYKSVSSPRPVGLRPGADSLTPRVTLVTAPD